MRVRRRLGWFVSLIMPDILGPALYLSIYLLVFAGDTISPRERLAIVVIAWWAAVRPACPGSLSSAPVAPSAHWLALKNQHGH